MLRHIDHSVEHHQAHSQMKDLAWFMIFRTFALSLFAIFIPIFLYDMGYPVWKILLYFFIAYTTEAIFEFFSVHLLRKIGPKKTILFSVPFTLVFLVLLATMTSYNWPIWLLGIVIGFALAFFWQPYHYLFSKLKKGKNATSVVSMRTSVVSLLGAMGPLIGAYIISHFGQEKLIFASVFILAFGSLFLLIEKDFKIKENFDIKEINLSKFKKQIISYMGFTWEETTAAVIWPFFIYMIFGTYKTVGGFTTFTLLATVTLTIIVGKISDNGGRRTFIKEGSILNFFINIIRVFSSTFYHILVANVLKSFSTAIFYSPFVSEYYLHADEEIRDEYIFMMEFFTDFARIIYFGILVLVALSFSIGTVFVVAITMSALGSLVSGLMPATKEDAKIQAKIKIIPQPKRVGAK